MKGKTKRERKKRKEQTIKKRGKKDERKYK